MQLQSLFMLVQGFVCLLWFQLRTLTVCSQAAYRAVGHTQPQTLGKANSISDRQSLSPEGALEAHTFIITKYDVVVL